MEETKNTSAIILDRRAYREGDSLITCYTAKFGKLTLAARGTKKLQSKLAGHLEPISLVDLMIIPGKHFDYIGAASGRDAFASIKENLNKLYFSGQAINWFDRLVKENQADDRLFFLLSEWLRVMAEYPGPDFSRENGEVLLAFFALRLLSELGYKPELEHCLICGQKIKPGQNYFDLLSGGLVGEECILERKKREGYEARQTPPISDNSIKALRYMASNRFIQAQKIVIDKKTIKELNIIISQFIQYVG